jgi:predicted aspartyl protease
LIFNECTVVRHRAPLRPSARLAFLRKIANVRRSLHRNSHFLGTILVAMAAPVANAYEARLISNTQVPTINARLIADVDRCSAKPLGQITVATLHGAPIVTLFANGHPVILLLDTGAASTILTPAVAERIGAKRPRIEFQRQIHGIGGTLLAREVDLRSFVVGSVSIPWPRVGVAPITMPSVFSTPLDGLLGADVLSGFDVDLDLPHYRMVLYAKRTCPNAPSWPGSYSAIETGQSLDNHLFFPVLLDGRRIVATIDTGAQRTVLSEMIARSLGVTDAVLAHDRPMITQGISGERLSSHLHRFSELKIGAEILRNPEFIIGNIKLKDADMVLGIDFLSIRRVWLSYGSTQIFLSR